MLKRAKTMHNKGYIHRDIKPANLVMGLHSNSNILYLIDFGLSKKYRNTSTQQHSYYKESKSFIGNERFASINAHLGIELSRRDDLESIGYVISFFLNGSLP